MSAVQPQSHPLSLGRSPTAHTRRFEHNEAWHTAHKNKLEPLGEKASLSGFFCCVLFWWGFTLLWRNCGSKAPIQFVYLFVGFFFHILKSESGFIQTAHLPEKK